jgi:hypothetical protein
MAAVERCLCVAKVKSKVLEGSIVVHWRGKGTDLLRSKGSRSDEGRGKEGEGGKGDETYDPRFPGTNKTGMGLRESRLPCA